VPRPTPHTPLVTQADSGDRIKWDDCHPASAAMAVFRATGGKRNYTWRELRAALEKRGIKDVPNVSNPVNEPQAVQASIDVAPEVKALIRTIPTWDSVVSILKAGGGYVCLYWYDALPSRLVEAHSGTRQFGHASFAEFDGTNVLWYDPLRPKGSQPKTMTLAELKRLAHWGVQATNANARHPVGWCVKAAPVVVPPVVTPPVVTPPVDPCAPYKAEVVALKAENTRLTAELAAANKRIADAKLALG